VIARRRGWASRGPDGLVLHLASSPLFAQLVATTLFDSFSLGRDRLALRARDGSEWIAFPDALVALGRADPASSDLLVRLVRRLLGGADVRSEAVAPESPPEWRTWDVPAPEAWPLRLDELLSMGERALPTLVERIDDERARQLRLLTLPARRRRGRHDVVILHAADDRQRAREVGAELEDLGLLAWIGDGGRGEPSADEWATMAEHAGAVAILLGRGAGRAWREQPFVPAYEELLRRREHGGPRLRWLPLVLPEASPAPRLPDFLRGFDSLRWHDEPRAERRRSLVDLTAAVLVDRVRL